MAKIEGAKRKDFFDLQISKIVVDDRNYRDIGDISELAASIAHHGIEDPIRVVRVADEKGQDRYAVVDGYRRMAAVQQCIKDGIKIERVPTLLQDRRKRAEHELILTRLVLNAHRKDASPLETAKVLKHLIDVVGCTMQEVGERLGWATHDIVKYLKLLEGAPRLIQALTKGEISVTAANEIISKYPERKDQEQALEAAKTASGKGKATVQAVHKAAPRKRPRLRRQTRTFADIQKALDGIQGEQVIPKGGIEVRAEADGFRRGIIESLKWVLGGEKTW